MQQKAFLFFFGFMRLCASHVDLRYSIPEEIKQGSVVGNIASDLGLDAKRFSDRKASLNAEGSGKRFMNVDNGKMIVEEIVDREQLCGSKPLCTLKYNLVLEKPLELHAITVEIEDINDNSPQFSSDTIKLEIQESSVRGAVFFLGEAHDADVGKNAVQGYSLEKNTHFSLRVGTNSDGGKYSELMLDKELDREKEKHIKILLTAFDGGKPERSGSVAIHVIVLDANDNSPLFSQSSYRVSLTENCELGTVVFTVTATDFDEGINGEVTYEFNRLSDKAAKAFSLNNVSGEIRVIGAIDYEEEPVYEIRIQAKDGLGLVSHTKVIVDVTDVNDNKPVIVIQSFSNPIPEDTLSGTEVGIINVQDKDSNGKQLIRCAIGGDVPFSLNPSIKNFYSIITTGPLDRELLQNYNLTIVATDDGSPPLSSSKNICLLISDVNDNSPKFEEQFYSAYVAENNKPGISICYVTARDPDWMQNGTVMYSLVHSEVKGVPVSSFLSIHADTGVICAVRSFDYERFRNFNVQVVARDNGSPPLSSNVTISVFITDENDNSPQILYPAAEGKSLMTEMVPKAALSGSLVSKVIAVDADSGQNSWLSYQIEKSTDPGLFSIGLYSGEIRALRDITESDSMKQNLAILVKDNGQPPLSATCSVFLLISDNLAEVPQLKDLTYEDSNSKLTFYLIIALVSVSTFFLTFIILIVALKFCQRRKPRLLFDGAVTIPSAYLPPNYAEVEGAGTLCSSYNYDGYLTTGSRTSDFKFVTSYNDNTLTASGTLNKISDDSNMTCLLDTSNNLVS